jgi:hypothetical protein
MDKIEMSLDDIIKGNKKTKGGIRRGGGSGGGFKRNTNTKGSPQGKKFGGIAKGRGRGGITRANYTRVR